MKEKRKKIKEPTEYWHKKRYKGRSNRGYKSESELYEVIKKRGWIERLMVCIYHQQDKKRYKKIN